MTHPENTEGTESPKKNGQQGEQISAFEHLIGLHEKLIFDKGELSHEDRRQLHTWHIVAEIVRNEGLTLIPKDEVIFEKPVPPKPAPLPEVPPAPPPEPHRSQFSPYTRDVGRITKLGYTKEFWLRGETIEEMIGPNTPSIYRLPDAVFGLYKELRSENIDVRINPNYNQFALPTLVEPGNNNIELKDLPLWKQKVALGGSSLAHEVRPKVSAVIFSYGSLADYIALLVAYEREKHKLPLLEDQNTGTVQINVVTTTTNGKEGKEKKSIALGVPYESEPDGKKILRLTWVTETQIGTVVDEVNRIPKHFLYAPLITLNNS